MDEFIKSVLSSQFEAALCMMDHCIRACPPDHWEARIANQTFRWVAYHTLFWVDLYLSPGNEDTFVLRDLHHRGGDERQDTACPGLRQEETLAYVSICHQKILDTMAAETAESLQGLIDYPNRPKTRGELHIYNLRHLQHHTGQLSAYLRRINSDVTESKVPWISIGWQ